MCALSLTMIVSGRLTNINIQCRMYIHTKNTHTHTAILLSWEFPEYRITENASIETIDQLFRIRLIKDFNSTTQLLIRIAVFPLVVADSGFPVAQGRGVDYDIGAGQSSTSELLVYKHISILCTTHTHILL